MLIYLIVDYIRSSELRERFRAQPELVLDWYEISQEDRDVLRTQGWDALVRKSHQELDRLLTHEDQPGPYDAVWPWPDMRGFIFTPRQGEVGDELTITLTALGPERFQERATVIFRSAEDTVRAERVEVLDPSGRRLQATVTFRRTGDYDIVVQQPGAADLVSERPFKVTRR